MVFDTDKLFVLNLLGGRHDHFSGSDYTDTQGIKLRGSLELSVHTSPFSISYSSSGSLTWILQQKNMQKRLLINWHLLISSSKSNIFYVPQVFSPCNKPSLIHSTPLYTYLKKIIHQTATVLSSKQTRLHKNVPTRQPSISLPRSPIFPRHILCIPCLLIPSRGGCCFVCPSFAARLPAHPFAQFKVAALINGMSRRPPTRETQTSPSDTPPTSSSSSSKLPLVVALPASVKRTDIIISMSVRSSELPLLLVRGVGFIFRG